MFNQKLYTYDVRFSLSLNSLVLSEVLMSSIDQGLFSLLSLYSHPVVSMGTVLDDPPEGLPAALQLLSQSEGWRSG